MPDSFCLMSENLTGRADCQDSRCGIDSGPDAAIVLSYNQSKKNPPRQRENVWGGQIIWDAEWIPRSRRKMSDTGGRNGNYAGNTEGLRNRICFERL